MKRHWPLAFLALPAWAEVLIYIAFLVLLVGAVVIWLLLKWCQQVLPPSSPTDTNTVVAVTVVTQVINTVRSPEPVLVDQKDNQFTLQFGISTDDGVTITPWIVAGQPYQLGTNGEADILQVDQGDVVVALTEGTQLFIVDVTTNGVVAPPVGTWTLIIQRSIDQINWLSVFTNAVPIDGVNTWTDSNDLPSAFYRVELP